MAHTPREEITTMNDETMDELAAAPRYVPDPEGERIVELQAETQSPDESHDKLWRIERLADERIADERLYETQRNRAQTFTDVLAYLIGLGAFSVEDLDVAIGMVRSADERLAQHRSGR